jgi:nucleotide-binding universal stress UspA family protein
MLERVLLPVDGSERFSETVSYVQELGRTGLQEMRLLHVEPTRGGEVEHDVADHPLLGRYRDAFAAQGWSVHAELRSGDPHQEISRCAVDMRASLVVMSTHGRSGIELVREGSVTEQVVRGSPCPVFIMHSGRADGSDAQPGHLFRRMLVPLDGSEVSAAILPCVQRFARSFETEVVLFHDDTECKEDSDTHRRREVLEQHGVALANAGVSVKLDCATHRRPIREILKRIDELNIDLVAMATHGEGGQRRALEDSVTANVMRHASCPLLVWSSDPQCPPGAHS